MAPWDRAPGAAAVRVQCSCALCSVQTLDSGAQDITGTSSQPLGENTQAK